MTSLSLKVYVPNWGKSHPGELYALVQVIFSETDIEVHLQKKLLSELMLVLYLVLIFFIRFFV